VQTLEEAIAVLVIEDDQVVQSMIEETLIDEGFVPSIAASGEEGVTILQGSRGKYRALVTDIKLIGQTDGWKVAKRAREMEPELPVIYVTGASAGQWSSCGVPNSILLTKPFAPGQLTTAIAQLLNTTGTGSM
jgi:DNA-binding response OmpR family regulator